MVITSGRSIAKWVVAIVFLMAPARTEDLLPGALFLSDILDVRGASLSSGGSGSVNNAGFFSGNPASAASLTEKHIHFNEMREWGDTKKNYLQGMYLMDGVAIGACGLYHHSSGGPPADSLGRIDTNADVGLSHFAFGVTLARRIGKFALGVNLKGFQSRIAWASSAGGGVDAGVQYAIKEGMLFSGLAVRNVGKAGPFVETEYKLPLSLVGGLNLVKTTGQFKLSLMTDFIYSHYHMENGLTFPIAAELTWKKNVFFRYGYPLKKRPASSSVGAGIRYGILQIDYTYRLPAEDLDATHAAGITLWNLQ